MTDADPKRMKVVFIGRRTGFNHGVMRWLKENYTLRAAFYIEEGWNRRGVRINEVKKRAKRVGMLRIADELLFYAYYVRRYGKGDERLWQSELPESFRSREPVDVPEHSCHDIHSPSWLNAIAEMEPDIIFSVCAKTIFRPKLFNIPRFGTFILHEGVTPEYRGLHTAGWAMLRGEPERIGYSLLKATKGIDAGPILCQGSYPKATAYGFHWRFVGHAALVHGLPDMKKALNELRRNAGAFEPVSQAGRASRIFTWIRFTDFVRHRWKRSTRPFFVRR